MIKGVIFDVDGTLVDSIPDFAEMINIFLGRLNLGTTNRAEIKMAIGQGARKSMENLLSFHGFELESKEQADELFKEYMDIYNTKPLDKSVLWGNVKATLEELKKSGYILSACTNKPHTPALKVTSRLGIYDIFNPFIDADSTPFLKPQKEICMEVLKHTGLRSEECVFVGDTYVDAQTAHNSSMPFICVSYGYETGDRNKLGTKAIIDDFASLLKILKQL